MSANLETIRAAISRFFIVYIWIHVPLVAGVAAWFGRDWLWVGAMAVIAAGLPTALWVANLSPPTTRVTIGVALVVMISLLLGVCHGSPWQVDIHMYYFAACAMVAIYCDIAVILATTSVVALHHLALNFVAPALVFPGGAQFARVIFHAVILIVENSALAIMAIRLSSLFARSERHLAEAVAATDSIRRSKADASEQHRGVEAERALHAQEMETAAAAQTVVVDVLAASLDRLAGGDLTCRIDERFGPAHDVLRRNFNASVATLQGIAAGVITAVGDIRANSAEIATAANNLSQRTEQQAAGLEQTTAALQTITNTVRRTAEGAQHAGAVVTQARADADRSGTVVGEAVTAMGEIDRSAQEITQIIGVIDEIAFQTNLLALNAGVEAARAGEAGRGFAVVAAEVRALAQRSAEAAKQIKTLISTSTQQVGRGVDLVGQTGSALHRIIEHVATISQIVTEISCAAREQATGLVEVNSALTEMDQVTAQNAAMVEQSTAAVTVLAAKATELSKLTSALQVSARSPGDAVAALRPAALVTASQRRPVLQVVGPRRQAATGTLEEF